MIMRLDLSTNQNRNKKYSAFLAAYQQGEVTVKDIARFGAKLMRSEKIHPHFFADHSLYNVSLYLTLFSLGHPFNGESLKQNQRFLDKKIAVNQAQDIFILFEQRINKRVPVEYITHETYYLGQKFYVNENVLVPRSLMKTQFKDFLAKVQWENYRVLDLCSGSGCIGISLALMHPKIKVDLADISDKALQVAQINIKNFGLEASVKCLQSDLFENIQDKYDLIITNPPYVPQNEYQAQPAEVKNEPKIALEAGTDGLDIVKKIMARAKDHLNPKGLLIAEVGYSGASFMKKKYPTVPFQWLICRSSTEKETLIETLIRWTGLLDSIFICEAKALPSS
jgi:ribosomal protein L3 glutamine methyltransferase